METKKLSFNEMEEIEGGSCGFAIGSLAVSAIGLFAGMATVNPFAIGLGVAGIYASGPGMLVACNLI